MTVYVDPVGQPAEYQRLLLGLLGADDPAAVQADTPRAIRSLIDAAADRLRTRPEPTEWSVYECVAHIVDAEIVYAGRYRWILAHDQPDLPGYDQDGWVSALHAGRRDELSELLAYFEPLRSANITLWQRSSEAERARVGQHRERGPESFELSFRIIAGHDRFHLAQARRALDRVSAAG